MFSVEFQTGALLLLAVVGLTIAFILWRDRNDRKLVEEQTREGVGHELRLIIQRFMAELSAITHGEPVAGGELMAVRHPQLDAIYSLGVPANRQALSIIGATYQTLQWRKNDLTYAAQAGEDLSRITPEAIDAVIDAIVTLYLWEIHGGVRPADATKTRTWQVREWMKGHGMVWNVFPGMHLRDEVVERLRQYGMHLTPRPLTHTAHEYYSLRYDRKADPHGPMWRRSKKKKSKDKSKTPPIKLAKTLPSPVGDSEQVVVG